MKKTLSMPICTPIRSHKIGEVTRPLELMDDEDELTFALANTAADFFKRAAQDGLARKGQIDAAGEISAVAENNLDILKNRDEPVGGVHDDDWDAHIAQKFKRFTAFFLVTREETGVEESVEFYIQDGKGRHQGGRAGNGNDGNAETGEVGDERGAWIGKDGGAAVGDEGEGLVLEQDALGDERGDFGFVVLVDSEDFFLDAEFFKQRAAFALFFADYGVDLLEDIQGAERDVTGVADGGGNNIEAAGQRCGHRLIIAQNKPIPLSLL
jgi:hypothetical protein